MQTAPAAPEQRSLPPSFRGKDAESALAQLFPPSPPSAPAPAPASPQAPAAKEKDGAAEESKDGTAQPDTVPPSPPCLHHLTYRDLLRPVAQEGDTIRVEYTCVDVSSKYLVCGSNTGVVDIYKHDGTGEDCELLKALVPPKRSKHTNVKVTCVKLDPEQKMLAVGNILGAVNVLLLDFSEGGRSQKMLHTHSHHEEALRCLAWDDLGQKLYSGCDGGLIVETRIPPQEAVASGSTTAAAAGQEGKGTGGGLSLLGSRHLGPLMTLFQTCSSTIWHREASELVQLTFYALPGRLPRGMQRAGDPPADSFLLASHARRCNVHLMNRSFAKSLLYSIQVEGGGTASSGRTIYGAALQAIMEVEDPTRIERLFLFLSRPLGKFWKVDLGTSNAVKTLAPDLVVPIFPLPDDDHDNAEKQGQEKNTSSHVSRPFPSPSPSPSPAGAATIGGRLALFSSGPPIGDCLMSWTHGGGLYLISIEKEGAVCLWGEGIHALSVLNASGLFKLVLLHGPEKAIGMLDVDLKDEQKSKGKVNAQEEEAAKVVQQAWRGHRAAVFQKRLEELLSAVKEAEERSRSQYQVILEQQEEQQEQRALQRRRDQEQKQEGEQEQEQEGEGEAELQMDPVTAVLLQEVETVCADARNFLNFIQVRQGPEGGVEGAEGAEAPAASAEASSLSVPSSLDPFTLALVEMVDKLLEESRRLQASAAAAVAATGPGMEATNASLPRSVDEEGCSGEGMLVGNDHAEEEKKKRPVVYKRIGRRWKERQKEEESAAAAAATTTATVATVALESPRSVMVGVKEIDNVEESVGSAILALAALEYEVRLVASSGLGLDLAFVGNGVVVRELAFLADGRPSPAQLCGRIRPGDALLAVNGVMLEPLALKDKLGVLLALAGENDTEIVLRFIAKEASSWSRSLIGLGGSSPKEESNPFMPWIEPPQQQQQQQEVGSTQATARPSTPRGGANKAKAEGGDLVSEQQRRAMEKMVELGLVGPKAGTGVELSQQQSVMQQFLTSTLLPWKYKFWEGEDGKGVGLGTAETAAFLRRWGEFGRSDINLGLVMAPEELNSELDRIAEDVRGVWSEEERAHESRFYDDHPFSALLGQATTAPAPIEAEHTDEHAQALRRRMREVGKRDIAREYLGLLRFKELLKKAMARGGKGATGNEEGRSSIATTGRRSSWGEGDDGPIVEGYQDPFGSSLSAGFGSGPPPMQVYLEAVPLADVMAELVSGEGEAVSDWQQEVGEEESQDLEAAMNVLSRALQTTLAEMVVAEVEAEAEMESGGTAAAAAHTAPVSKPWPPIQLTHVAGMAVAVQQAHAILGTSETMLQEWLRCFNPLPPSQRHMIWESSSFLNQHIHPDDAEMIRQHHLLTCELATLYFQMHTIWSLLEKTRPGGVRNDADEDDQRNGAGGTEEVRLRVAWGRENEEDTFDPTTGILHSLARGQGRPTQWNEDEAMVFLEEFGAYVMLEGVVKVCLARGFERALWWVVKDLAPHEARFQQAEKNLVQALKANVVDEAALVRQIKETDYPLSLAVVLLPEVVASSSFATSTMVAEIHHAFFPDMRPWLIRSILAAKEKEKGNSSSTFAAAALIINDAANAVWHSCLDVVGFQGRTEKLPHTQRQKDVDVVSLSSLPSILKSGTEEEEEHLLSAVLSEGEENLSVLQQALHRRLALLRRQVSAGDVLTLLQTHIWDTTAVGTTNTTASLPSSFSSPSSSLPISEQRNVLPPLYLGIALMEAAAAGEAWRGPALPPSEEEEWRKGPPEGRGQGEMTDPVEGQGGIGMALNPRKDYYCGVCQLSCCTGGGGVYNVLFFACGHMYHRFCLPEVSCILCLKENFPPF